MKFAGLLDSRPLWPRGRREPTQQHTGRKEMIFGSRSSLIRTIGCLLALACALLALSLAPAAGAAGRPSAASWHHTAAPSSYLALGDSLAFGYSQAKFNSLLPNEPPAAYDTGYVDDFARCCGCSTGPADDQRRLPRRDDRLVHQRALRIRAAVPAAPPLQRRTSCPRSSRTPSNLSGRASGHGQPDHARHRRQRRARRDQGQCKLEPACIAEAAPDAVRAHRRQPRR